VPNGAGDYQRLIIEPIGQACFIGVPIPSAGETVRVLVLTRKSNQSIMIGDDIEISVLAVMGEKVRIGIEAPRSVPVFRREVYVEIQEGDDDDGDQDDVDAALNGLRDTG
jgi:carbon storage regulator